MLQNDVPEMNVPSIRAAKYVVTLIDEASGNVSASHAKTKGEAAELIKQHLRWVELRTDCILRKIVFDGGQEIRKRKKEAESRRY